jgi:glycosyltransferase involved in cell wall biosynthesis
VPDVALAGMNGAGDDHILRETNDLEGDPIAARTGATSVPRPGSGRGRVCFFAELAYPVLSGVEAFAGGGEVLVVLLARGLARLGFEVHLVCRDYGRREAHRIGEVTVHPTYREDEGLPVLRFFHPRLSRSLRELARVDADVYYVVGSGMPAGVAHDLARARRAGFVLHAMTDLDARRDLPHYNVRDRWWYRRALRDADANFTQTEDQREAFRRAHGVETTVLPNIVAVPDSGVDAGQDGHVMWVGTYRPHKRPDWFTRLAREIPDRRFVMAGVVQRSHQSAETFEAARAVERDCSNLTVLGFQPEPELRRLMSKASLLVHTSPVEGFSNVMLEAWGLGLPSISCVNPDGIVTRLGLGEAVTEFPDLVREVSRWMSDPASRREAGARARRYVIERHSEAVVLDQLGRTLDGIVARVRCRRGAPDGRGAPRREGIAR